VSLPRIRSESPAFDLHHPELAELEIINPQADAAAPHGEHADEDSEDETGPEGDKA
jgi:cytochrome c oxidase subunit 1